MYKLQLLYICASHRVKKNEVYNLYSVTTRVQDEFRNSYSAFRSSESDLRLAASHKSQNMSSADASYARCHPIKEPSQKKTVFDLYSNQQVSYHKSSFRCFSQGMSIHVTCWCLDASQQPSSKSWTAGRPSYNHKRKWQL